MNYLVQRGKVRSQVIKVPEGLPELLSDITREVLRCQPTTECLCQFIIDYLHAVIVTREKATMARSIIDRAMAVVDEIIADMCICDITKEKAGIMTAAMEECFRRFLEKRRCEERREKSIIKFQDWDMLDDIIGKCKFSEKELMMTRPLIEDAYNRFVEAYMSAAEGTDGTEALYDYFKMREENRKEEERVNAAATKIQANFRGFRVRRSMSLNKADQKERLTEIPAEDLEELNAAASKIQKFFRHYLKPVFIVSGIGETGEACKPESQVSMLAKKTETLKKDEHAIQETTAEEGQPVAAPPPEISVEAPIAGPEPAPPPTEPETTAEEPAHTPETAPQLSPTPSVPNELPVEGKAAPAGEPLAEEPPAGEPPAGEPLAEEPPAEEPPAEAAPAESSAAE